MINKYKWVQACSQTKIICFKDNNINNKSAHSGFSKHIPVVSRAGPPYCHVMIGNEWNRYLASISQHLVNLATGKHIQPLQGGWNVTPVGCLHSSYLIAPALPTAHSAPPPITTCHLMDGRAPPPRLHGYRTRPPSYRTRLRTVTAILITPAIGWGGWSKIGIRFQRSETTG